MPNNIKPSEVSDVLLRQLENIDTNIKFEEVGIVLSIGDGVARIYGLTGVTENELIEFDNGVMAVAMNLEEDNVGAVLLGSSEGIKEGQSVKRTGRVASIVPIGRGQRELIIGDRQTGKTAIAIDTIINQKECVRL